jgi:hypothetical protein
MKKISIKGSFGRDSQTASASASLRDLSSSSRKALLCPLQELLLKFVLEAKSTKNIAFHGFFRKKCTQDERWRQGRVMVAETGEGGGGGCNTPGD